MLEFIADGVDYPIGQQGEEEVRVRVLIALVVYGAQFKVRLQLATAFEDGVGGEECGLFGDEGTLLHQVGRPSLDLHDFVAAQIGQVAGV